MKEEMAALRRGLPAGQPVGGSAREGARALLVSLGERAGRSPNGLLMRSVGGPAVGTLGPMDADLMARTVARLHEQEPMFDWVGVYVVDGDTLVLGPFEGLPTEHERIPVGAGVCGSVAERGITEVVPDVRLRPGHIACDLHTRSEAVAPIVRGGPFLGVLDVDSNALHAFRAREAAPIAGAAEEPPAGPEPA